MSRKTSKLNPGAARLGREPSVGWHPSRMACSNPACYCCPELLEQTSYFQTATLDVSWQHLAPFSSSLKAGSTVNMTSRCSLLLAATSAVSFTAKCKKQVPSCLSCFRYYNGDGRPVLVLINIVRNTFSTPSLFLTYVS